MGFGPWGFKSSLGHFGETPYQQGVRPKRSDPFFALTSIDLTTRWYRLLGPLISRIVIEPTAVGFLFFSMSFYEEHSLFLRDCIFEVQLVSHSEPQERLG